MDDAVDCSNGDHSGYEINWIISRSAIKKILNSLYIYTLRNPCTTF